MQIQVHLKPPFQLYFPQFSNTHIQIPSFSQQNIFSLALAKIFPMKYVELENQDNVRSFAYVGSNLSISYQYIWGPLAEKVLDYVPESMAPNLITFLGEHNHSYLNFAKISGIALHIFIGFLCVVVGHILIMIAGEFGEPIPVPNLLAFGILLLVYQTLDNVDGKQARKTKTSSPLGMLFDHGSDSLSAYLIGISVLKILAVTNRTVMLFVMVTHVLSVFFCAIWNQYNTDKFELGTINPVDDGIPAVALLAFANCFITPEIYNTSFLFSTMNVDILLILVFPLILVLVNINKKLLQLTKHTKKETLLQLLQPALIFLTMTAVLLLGPEDYLDNNFYAFGYTVCFLWSRNIINMQLCYIAKQKFALINFPILVFMLGHLYLIVENLLMKKHLVQPHEFAVYMLCVQVLFYMEFIGSIILQMSNILGIRVFSIQKTPEVKTK